MLREQGAMSGAALAKRACLRTASLSRILQTLVEKGYVVRQQDPSNRRRQTISLLPPGAEVIDSHARESRRVTCDIEQRFGPEKHRLLLDLLDELTRLDP